MPFIISTDFWRVIRKLEIYQADEADRVINLDNRIGNLGKSYYKYNSLCTIRKQD